jgi:hypothetical protein
MPKAPIDKFALRAAAQRIARAAGHTWKDLPAEQRAAWRKQAKTQITPADQDAGKVIAKRQANREARAAKR